MEPELIEITNPVTGLPGLRCGDVIVTAYHNHIPYGGNWRWVIFWRGQVLEVRYYDEACDVARNVAAGNGTLDDWRRRLDPRSVA